MPAMAQETEAKISFVKSSNLEKSSSLGHGGVDETEVRLGLKISIKLRHIKELIKRFIKPYRTPNEIISQILKTITITITNNNYLFVYFLGRLGKIHFPRMLTISHAVCRSCFECQTAKPRAQPQKGIYRSVHKGFPWDCLSCDVVGPLKNCRGFKYLLTAKVSNEETKRNPISLTTKLLIITGLIHPMD